MKIFPYLRSLAALLGLWMLLAQSPAQEPPAKPAPATAAAKPGAAETAEAADTVDGVLTEILTEVVDEVSEEPGGKAKAVAEQAAGGRKLRDIKAVGQDVHIKKGERVRSLSVTQGSAKVDGEVMRDAVVVNGKLRINGEVHGAAVNVGGGLVLGSGARVGKDAVGVLGGIFMGTNSYIGGDAVGVLGGVHKKEGAEVRGDTVPISIGGLSQFLGEDGFRVPEWVSRSFEELVLKARPLAFTVGWPWAVAGVFLLGHLLLLALFPGPVAATAKLLDERGATSFLMGLLALPLLAFLVVILAATGVGLLVVPFLFAAFVLAAVFGKVGLLRHLGGALLRLLKAEGAPFAAFMVGAVLVSLCYVIPFAGLFAWAVLTMWGLGAALLALFAGFSKERAPAAVAAAPGWAQPAFAPAAAPVPTPAPMTTLNVEVPSASTSPGDGGGLGFAAASLASAAEPSPRASSAPADIPGMPEALTLARVGFGRRFWATLLDWMLLFFVVDGPVLHLDHRWEKLRWLLYLAYFIGLYAWKGTTLGGLVLGLKVARLDGRPLDFACALVRALGAVLSGLPALLGWFWCAWDPERQTWHDKLAGTVVVRVEKSAPLV